MSHNIHVALGDRAYAIAVGKGLLEQAGPRCAETGIGRTGLMVSDTNVDALYGDRVEQSLRDAGFQVARAVVPAGETSKSFERLQTLLERMADDRLDRASFVFALGGGVVGDLAGFAAASFMRGIALVQAPTSLLAMVDSSVGGKTGINLPQGKNLVGAFHQPALVLADTATQATLPEREFRAGLAEVIKYGVIRDAALFDRLEKDGERLLRPDHPDLDDVIAACCAIKADVVAADEREGGLRAILNFGHTLGHALENAAGYGRYLHGEAVAVGMAFAARLSTRVAGLPKDDADRIVALIRACGLPASAPTCAWSDLRKGMTVDKKNRSGAIRFVLARRIGDVAWGMEAPEDALEAAWKDCG